MSDSNYKINIKDDSRSGIYLITNKLNGKVYVGQSANIYYRFARHKSNAKLANKTNTPLMNAYKKYGFDNFTFSVIEYVERSDLTIKEQYWMDFYKSAKREFGYNACPAANSCLGYKHSNLTKQKLSLVQSGRKHSIETRLLQSAIKIGRKVSAASKEKNRLAHLGKKFPNRNGRNVEQICPTTKEIINRFKSASAAKRALGKSTISNILAAAHGIRPTAGGYVWRFACQN